MLKNKNKNQNFEISLYCYNYSTLIEELPELSASIINFVTEFHGY